MRPGCFNENTTRNSRNKEVFIVITTMIVMLSMAFHSIIQLIVFLIPPVEAKSTKKENVATTQQYLRCHSSFHSGRHGLGHRGAGPTSSGGGGPASSGGAGPASSRGSGGRGSVACGGEAHAVDELCAQAEQDQGAGLVRGGELDRHVAQQRGDAQRRLHAHHAGQAGQRPPGVGGEGPPHRAPPGSSICQSNSCSGGVSQHTVVKLHSSSVLKEISPKWLHIQNL
mmetsp:Transcript_8774/g.12256  ORF Transcript_8774/g.12256 Transcript_8774/m.12256 type:complete len:226 (+) Transcript_8774:124-801(+)